MRQITEKLFCLVIVWITLLYQNCDGSPQENRLFNQLMEGYNKNVRPSRKADKPVTLRFGVSLLEVLDLQEDLGHISIKAWLRMVWKDEYLSWNPNKNGGITKMFFTPDQIWTPDMTLFNGIKTEVDNDQKVVVFSDGEVNWIPPATFTSSCRHEFRGNHWKCQFRFGSWVYDGRLLDIVPHGKTVDLDVSSFAPTDHWFIVEHSGERSIKKYECCPAEPYVSMEYEVKLRKKLGPSLLGKKK